MAQVFSEPLRRRYYAPWYSWAVWFRFLLYSGMIVVSFVIAYATGNFWYKTGTDLIQPSVHYTGDALLILEGATAGSEQIYSTSPQISAAFSTRLLAASVASGEEDWNFDGKPDQLRFLITAQSTVPVYGVKLLLQFQYQLKGHVRLNMHSLAYVQHSAGTPGGGLVADGVLALKQYGPIQEQSYHQSYLSTPLTATSSDTAISASGALHMASILAAYNDRNVTTVLESNYPVWQPSNGNEFVLDVRVRVPDNQPILYSPQVIQMLKFAWIQWLATYVVLWWLVGHAEAFMFRYRLIGARSVTDVQPRAQKF